MIISALNSTLTVGELKQVLAGLPDHAALLAEAGHFKYDVTGALGHGTKTDSPGLVLKLSPLEVDLSGPES